MAMRGKTPTPANEKPNDGVPKGNPLASILADMLRSALAWEEDHGGLPKTAEYRSDRRKS